MTNPIGDDSSDLPVPPPNTLHAAAAAAMTFIRQTSISPSDPTELRVAKHCFRCFFVLTVASAAAVVVLQTPPDGSGAAV